MFGHRVMLTTMSAMALVAVHLTFSLAPDGMAHPVRDTPPTLVLVIGPPAAADRARAALTAAHLRADVVAAPDADATDRVDRRAVVLVTPGASPDAAARAEALAGERGWSVVAAKPARCAEVVASLL